MDYRQFINSKKLAAEEYGFELSKDNPALFDFQKECVRWSVKKGRSALFQGCGIGKAQHVDQRILTPDGWKRIGDAVVGDLVFGSDGKAHKIVGVFPQGERELREVLFSDGTSVKCDREHLWYVLSQKQQYLDLPGRVMTVNEIEKRGLSFKGGQKKHFVPMPKPMDFGRDDDLPVDPYTLGVLLGDGSLGNGTPAITTPDEEIISHLIIPAGCSVSRKNISGDKCPSYSIIGGEYKNSKNPMKSALESLGVYGKKSEDKFIPEQYKFASPEIRLAIVQGLLDTDGHCTGSCIEYSTASIKLAEDLIFIIRSLGGTSSYSVQPAHYTKNGERVDCLEKHRMVIKLPANMPAFRLSRKLNRHNPIQRKKPLKSIVGIEPAGFGECVCIKVDAKDSLYVTEGFTLTHNTPQQLSWSQAVHEHTNGDVLILAPLAVSKQTVREGRKFGVDVNICRSQDGVKPGVNITNYEMVDNFNADHFAGIVLDESSILKCLTGKTRTKLIKTFSATPYRLCCTATPAPNDYTELGNHAEFLGIMSVQEMLSRWFINDAFNVGDWRLKKHAEQDFWRWVSSWAICMTRPSDIGYEDGAYILPPLTTVQHIVKQDMTDFANGLLVKTSNPSATQLKREMRKSLMDRCDKAAELAEGEEPIILWCNTNEEADALKARVADAKDVRGAMKAERKEEILEDFASGNLRALITKPSIAGHGMNFQHCNRMVFVGLSYSFEERYQAVRRCWRFGQEREVFDHVVLGEAEMSVFKTVKDKEQKHLDMERAMAGSINKFSKENGVRYREYVAGESIVVPNFLKKRAA